MTALHVAAGAGQIVALYFLITAHAADVNVDDVRGMTPLDHAVREQRLSCIVLLVSNAGVTLVRMASTSCPGFREPAPHLAPLF